MNEMKSEHVYICDCQMLTHICSNSVFLAPSHPLSHTGDLVLLYIVEYAIDQVGWLLSKLLNKYQHLSNTITECILSLPIKQVSAAKTVS